MVAWASASWTAGGAKATTARTALPSAGFHPDNIEEQDRVDSANLYQTLTEQVRARILQPRCQRHPARLLKRMRHSMATLVPQFTTDACQGIHRQVLRPEISGGGQAGSGSDLSTVPIRG